MDYLGGKKNISFVACIFLILLSAFFLALFYFKYFPIGVPLGWDAPYYVYKNQLLRAEGFDALVSAIGGVRVGYTLLSATITAVFGVSARNVELILPILMQFALSLELGFIFYKIFQKKSAFIGTALFSLLSFSLNDLILRNNSDNLFALTIAILAGIALIKYIESAHKKLSMLFIIGALFLIIGTTHLETLLLADLMFGFAILFLLIIDHANSFFKKIIIHAKLIIVLVASNLLSGLIWFNYLRPFINSFKSVTNTVGLNNTPFYSSFNLVSFLKQQNYVGLYIFLPLIILSLIVIFFQFKRGKLNAAIIVFASWLCTMAVLYAYFWIQKVPYNFMLRIVELTPLVAAGAFVIWYFSPMISNKIKIGIMTMILTASIINIAYYFTKVDHLFVPKEVFRQLDDLNIYLSNNKTDQAYVFVSTKKTENSLGAFYGMWLNWTLGSVPLSMIQKTQVFFGEPSRFFECHKYEMQDREYEGYANSFIDRYCSETHNGKYFVLRGFYDNEVMSNLDKISTREIAPGVIELFP